jgi:adenosylcobinamide-phosphate synthase
MEILYALLLGFLLDQLLGDPRWLPHPVRWIGRLVEALEKPLRQAFPERLGGVILLILVTGTAGGLTWVTLELTAICHPLAKLGLSAILIYYGLAARSLASDTGSVLKSCEQEDWPQARKELNGLVGRQTSELLPEEIYRASIETVAENTSDAIIAPLFYAAMFGPVGTWVYKAINTLDSMVGYRDPRYQKFGWASARADDIANYLPARLTYALLSLAAWITACKGKAAWRIGWRDGRKHPSPNAGWPEAAMAGALGVQLGGSSSYSDGVEEKPLLGESLEPLTLKKARQAIRVMQVTAWLGLATAGLFAIFLSLADFPGAGAQLRQSVEEFFECVHRSRAEIHGQRGFALTSNGVLQPMDHFLEILFQSDFLIKLVEPSFVPIDDGQPIDLGRQAAHLGLAFLPAKRGQLQLQGGPIDGHRLEPQRFLRGHLHGVLGVGGTDYQVGSDRQVQRSLARDLAAGLV